MKDKIDIGFIGAGNLGRHAILGLIDSYNIKVSDPVQNQEIILALNHVLAWKIH